MRKFVSNRSRNEALDCRVYAYAAYVGLQPDLRRIVDKQKVINAESEFVDDVAPQKDSLAKAREVSRKSQRLQRPIQNFAQSWRNL